MYLFYTRSLVNKANIIIKDLPINPLSPNIHIQILQTDLYTFPYKISWEKLIKDQRFFSL